MKKVLVCGAGGFIGYHLVRDLKNQGHYVIGADIKRPLYAPTDANEFYVYDLRNLELVEKLITSDIAEIYQLAADMGGTGYIGIGNHDSDIMHNSAMINLNIIHEACKKLVAIEITKNADFGGMVVSGMDRVTLSQRMELWQQELDDQLESLRAFEIF